VRSSLDALEGIVAAIKRYEDRLRRGSPNDLDDFWNRHKKALPTPKEEERVSDKICDAIRQYFDHYAVIAEREVQLFRRKLPESVGGAPGSKVDVLWQSPAVGTLGHDTIAIPIEVKLAHNPEARTGLKDQLVDRYMLERDTDAGAFVVGWMGKNVPRAYRPLWPDVAAAETELEKQAREATIESDGMDVCAIVIDLSLPLARKPARSTERTGKNAKKSPAKGRDKRQPKRKR
jgi:hypothetical protein